MNLEFNKPLDAYNKYSTCPICGDYIVEDLIYDKSDNNHIYDLSETRSFFSEKKYKTVEFSYSNSYKEKIIFEPETGHRRMLMIIPVII